MKIVKEHKEGKYIIYEWVTGKEWYKNGERHREDGPAVEFVNGAKFWYLNSKVYLKKEWKNEMRRRKLELLGL